jgi:phosphoribosylformimino-5-aminoimidazole carboxamide ribotide isomerase
VILYPAIDIRGGRAVRLVQGDYDRETQFDADPLDAAQRWLDQGARALHVVDLDGARSGEPENLEHVGRIAKAAGEVPVQVGGGLRSAESVVAVLEAGAARAVLGTAALEDPALLESLVADSPDSIVAAADARAGYVAVEGWERESSASADGLIRELADRGVRRFAYTPVEVDGTLEGPEVAGLRDAAFAAGDGELLYSGGVGSLDDLRALAGLELPTLGGVIVGRALYEGRFTVAAGQEALASIVS